MRRIWGAAFLLCLTACGTSSVPTSDDAASPIPTSTTSPDAPDSTVPIVDGGKSEEGGQSISDATPDATPDAGNGLGRPCDPNQANNCPFFSHPSGVSANGTCFGSPSKMFARCTFACGQAGNPNQPDQQKTVLCESLGGVCERWKVDGIFICQVD